MADDPLAKWRRAGSQPVAPSPVSEPAVSASPSAAPDDTYGYRAFTLLEKGVSDYLSIVPARGLVRCFNYNWLVEIAHDGDRATQLALVFNFGPVVFIYGRNLEPLVLAMLFRRTESVREFDAAQWPKPNDSSAPIVERIEIQMKDGPASSKSQGQHERAGASLDGLFS